MKTTIIILLYVLSINIVNSQHRLSYSKDVPNKLLSINELDSMRSIILDDINKARINPKEYGIFNNLQSERLDTIENKERFIINTLLNYKAQQYSCKLGTTINFTKGDEFTIKHSKMKYNESICLSNSINNCIYLLIQDLNTPYKGHRKHLLSMNNDNTKIGIGIYKFNNKHLFNSVLVVIVTE